MSLLSFMAWDAALLANPQWLSDGVHYNTDGQTAYGSMLLKQPIEDAALEFRRARSPGQEGDLSA